MLINVWWRLKSKFSEGHTNFFSTWEWLYLGTQWQYTTGYFCFFQILEHYQLQTSEMLSILTIQSNAQVEMEQRKTRNQVKLQNVKPQSIALHEVQIPPDTKPVACGFPP